MFNHIGGEMLEVNLSRERWEIVPNNTDPLPLLNTDTLIYQSIVQFDDHEEFVTIFHNPLNSGGDL